MPALRGNKRKSQTGTPLDTPAGTPPSTTDARKEKSQSSLDGWIEPVPQNLAASFEEHGFTRQGVLQTMAPLGVPPNPRTKPKVRGEQQNVRKSLLGLKSSAFPGDDDATTPEVTPAPELPRGDSERLDEEEEDVQAVFVEQDEDEDDDYMPTKKKAKTSHGTKTPVRGKSVGQGKPFAQSKTPVQNGTPQTVASTPNAQAPAVQNGMYSNWSQMDHATRQRIVIAVNHATERFQKAEKHNVGAALRGLLEECKGDDKLAKSLNGVIHQNESAEDWGVFRDYLKTAKKQIKRAIKEKRAQDALKSAKAARTQSPSHLPAGISPLQNPSSPLDTDTVAAPTIETVESNGLVPERAAITSTALLNNVEPLGAVPNPLTTAPTFPVADAPAPPARKMNSKSPRKQQALNGHLAPQNDRDTTAEVPTNAPTPMDDDGSDSALSEVDDDLIKNVEAPAPEPVRVSTPAVAPKKTKSAINAANAAHARAVKKARQGSAKPPGKNSKAQPLTDEERAEQANIERARARLEETQISLREELQGYATISDMRFDDEHLETESLTESQIEVGPPTQPRRAGKHPQYNPRNGLSLKRPREDGSRFSSPHPGSAATSRPSTPAAGVPNHMPSKRLKLNNGNAHQAARTKKSPVKNRDGPIAGVPHTGGGGSRQLGPDDNDPSSPPSETDDLCSACKGPGEFVICDHCPRVFHFLCCDPPMLEAPTGSFSCFECSAKLKPSGEPAESYTPLGPLFKALESINTRAFTLPADVQTHFEGVSAREDGSYLEETKKFPLSKSSGYGYQKPDYLKILDGDKPILCASCGLTSANKRQMLKCDFCASHWHLDCLDPPLANPPHINLDSAHRDAWRCPRHIEHDLRSGYVVQNDLNEAQDTAVVDASVARLGRKVRKPRHPHIVQPTFLRGLRNNGLIEVINDPDDETDSEGNYVFGNEEKDFNSHIYRVPEKGLVLDFIDKVKSGRVEKRTKQAEASQKSAVQRKDSMARFAARSIEEQQAALNLTRLARREQDIGLNETSVDALVLSLTAEAPTEVTTAISDAAPAPVSESEREQLLKLQKLINMRLAASQP